MARIYGFINRQHLQRKFEISTPQASADLQRFIETHPGVLTYNHSSKRFEAGHIGCIACASGNDLPEGEKCSACGRIGPAIHDHGLRLRDMANEEVRAAISSSTETSS